MRCTDTSLVLGLFFRWDKPNPRQGLAPAPTPNPESSQSRESQELFHTSAVRLVSSTPALLSLPH